MSNPFSTRTASLSGPGRDYAPVTPNDSVDLPDMAIALYVETGGAVAFVSASGANRVVTVPDFGWLLCGVSRVLATGTTAAGIHAVTVA